MNDSPTIKQLIRLAKRRMRQSSDPIHDIGHARRVARYAAFIGQSCALSSEEQTILEIAAWWHDVGRTVTKKPSFVWMIFLDDIISAFWLAWSAKRIHGFDQTCRRAVYILLGHSFGTGKLLTRLLLDRRDRQLLTIIEDADKLDVLCVERLESIRALMDDSHGYSFGYRILSWYSFTSRHLQMQTDQGRKFFYEVLQEFSAWINQPNIANWHTEQFGEVWAEKTLTKINQFIESTHAPVV